MQLTVNGYNIVIDGEWSGEYYPATREQPEEKPEFEISAIYLEDSYTDILYIVSQSFLADIYNEIYR
jgi:hypothetical protein